MRPAPPGSRRGRRRGRRRPRGRCLPAGACPRALPTRRRLRPHAFARDTAYAHAFARDTALSQPARNSATRSRGIAGSKRRSTCQLARDVVVVRPVTRPPGRPGRRRRAPWSRSPSAAPPARRAGRPGTASAGRWRSRRRRRAVRASVMPASFCIASSTSALWKAIASSAARAMCAPRGAAREAEDRRRARRRPSAARPARRTPARGTRRRCRAPMRASASTSAARADDAAARRAATARPRRR